MLRQLKEFTTVFSLLLLAVRLSVAVEFLYYGSATDKIVASKSDSIGNVVVHDEIHCASTCLRTKLCVAVEFHIEQKRCTLLGNVEDYETTDEGQTVTLFQTGSCNFQDSQSETRRK